MLFPLLGQKANLSHVWNLEELNIKQSSLCAFIHLMSHLVLSTSTSHTLCRVLAMCRVMTKSLSFSFQYPGRWEGGILFNVIFLKHDRIHKSKNYLRDRKNGSTGKRSGCSICITHMVAQNCTSNFKRFSVLWLLRAPSMHVYAGITSINIRYK